MRSHMRFGCEWDSRLVALLLALNHSRALVTAYPPNYSPMQGLQHAARIEPSRLVALGFDDLDALAPDAPAPASELDAVGGARAHGKRESDRHRQAADQQTRLKILRIGSRLVPAEECARRGVGAVGSLFWAAGFNFGRGTAVLEVPSLSWLVVTSAALIFLCASFEPVCDHASVGNLHMPLGSNIHASFYAEPRYIHHDICAPGAVRRAFGGLVFWRGDAHVAAAVAERLRVFRAM